MTQPLLERKLTVYTDNRQKLGQWWHVPVRTLPCHIPRLNIFFFPCHPYLWRSILTFQCLSRLIAKISFRGCTNRECTVDPFLLAHFYTYILSFGGHLCWNMSSEGPYSLKSGTPAYPLFWGRPVLDAISAIIMLFYLSLLQGCFPIPWQSH